jgi:hypothetical protein
VQHLKILLSEREKKDLKKGLAKYETQKDDNTFKKDNVTNGLDNQSFVPGEQAENDVLQKN